MILNNSWQLYGKDFTRALIEGDWKELSYRGSRGWIMMRKGPWKYIRYMTHDCIEELYQLDTDPDELDNLAVQKEHRDLLLQLRKEAEQEFLNRDGDFVKLLPRPRLAYTD